MSASLMTPDRPASLVDYRRGTDAPIGQKDDGLADRGLLPNRQRIGRHHFRRGRGARRVRWRFRLRCFEQLHS